jgi:hypothetical protein
MTEYTLTSDAKTKKLTNASGKSIIDWGKGDSQESSLEITGSISLTYEECVKNFGLAFLKSENPEVAKKVEESLKAKNEKFEKEFCLQQKSQNEIISENLKSGLWTRLGMRLIVSKTGKKVCF